MYFQLWRKLSTCGSLQPFSKSCNTKGRYQTTKVVSICFNVTFFPTFAAPHCHPKDVGQSSSEAILGPGVFFSNRFWLYNRLFYCNGLSASTLDTNTYDESILSQRSAYSTLSSLIAFFSGSRSHSPWRALLGAASGVWRTHLAEACVRFPKFVATPAGRSPATADRIKMQASNLFVHRWLQVVPSF